jgi:hypothetical protein
VNGIIVVVVDVRVTITFGYVGVNELKPGTKTSGMKNHSILSKKWSY